MRVFDIIKSKNIDELSEWLDKHCLFDNVPWFWWWDKKYCSKCESIIVQDKETDSKQEFSYCELYEKCIYFKNLNDITDNKQIIKMWLESECENIEQD